MSESDNTRLSSLGWVKDEINKSLEEARTSLEAYVESEDEADTTGLQRCHDVVQQVRGTLQMVQLQGALLLTEEMLKLIDALHAGSDKISDRGVAYEALMRSILQLPDYFAQVQSGQTDAAVILLPLINDLRTAYGEDAVVSQALFAPNFNGIMPPEMPDIQSGDGDISALIKGKRHQVHLSMLGLFRGKDVEASLDKIIGLYLEFCATAHSESIKQLYWIAAALCEGIRDGGLDPEALPVKPILGQIDRQSKMIIDDGEEVLAADPPSELIRILLYYVASSSSQGERVAEIKTAFNLNEYLPDEQELERLREKLAGPSAEVLGTVIQGIAQELDRARDMLDIYNRTGEQDNERLQQMVQALRNAAGTIAMVGDTELQVSINEYCDNIDGLIDGSKNAEEAGMSNLAEFMLQIDIKVQAMLPGSADQSFVSSAGPALTGSSGSWDVRRAVVKESAANMSTAKDVIAAFVESPASGREQLEIVSGLLQQIAGSLKVASLDRSSDIIYALRAFIDKELIKKEKTLNEQELESLAEAVSSADYYLEAVIDELPNKESALDMAEASLDLLGYAASDVDEALEELAEGLAEEAGEEEIQIKDDSTHLETLAEDLLEEYGSEGESVEADSIELTPEDVAQAYTEEPEMEDVPLDETLSEVEEGDADLEEIDVVPPEETEEEMASRLAEEAADVDLGDLPSIDAVDETPDAEIEELSVGVPEESEEDMLERVKSSFDEADDSLLKTGEIDVVDLDSEVEDVSLEGGEEPFDSEASSADVELGAVEVEDLDSDQSDVEIPAEPEADQVSDSLMSGSPLGDDLDDEIVEIFLEEAEEVLDELRKHFPTWRDDTSNIDSLTVIRRSFHTLKGSGRMVGANQIGEFSWSIENLLNKVIDNSINATTEVMDTISQAIDVLPVMVGQLQGGSAPDIDINEVSGVADALAAGKFIAGDDDSAADEPEKKNQILTPPEEDISSHSGIFEESGISRPLDSEELRLVYTDETNQHLEGLRAFVARCRADAESCYFSNSEIVILHTLHGGSATVGANELRQIFDIFEPLAVLFNEHNVSVDEPLLKLCERTIDQVQGFLDEVNGGGQKFVLDVELLEELQRLFQEKKDLLGAVTGSIDILKLDADGPEAEVEGEVTEDVALDEISSSLEDLHDLMSSDVALAEGEIEELTPTLDEVNVEENVAEEVGLEEVAVEGDVLDEADAEEVELEEVVDEIEDFDDLELPVAELIAEEESDSELEATTGAVEEIDPEILDIFLEEADELLGSIEQTLDDWQDDQSNHELMVSIQRDIHTLKGGARMVNQSSLADVGHAMETLLTAVVDGQVEVSDAMYATLHTARDTLQDRYEDLKEGKYNLPTDMHIVSQLEALRHGKSVAEEPVVEEVLMQEEAPVAEPVADDESEADSSGFDLIEIFMEEAGELLESIDQTLDDWLNDENNMGLAVQLQRDIHTLKGGARMVSLTGIGDLGHALETLLTAIVDGHLEISRPLFDGMHEVKDELQTMYEAVQQGKGDGKPSEQIMGLLHSLRTGEQVIPDEDSQPVALDDTGSFEVTPSGAVPAFDDSQPVALGDSGSFEITPSGATAALEDSGGFDLTPSDAMAALDDENSTLTRIVAKAEKAEKIEKKTPDKKEQRTKGRVEHETVRVRSDLIDGLVNLAGETNIFRSRLEQQSSTFRFSLGELDQTVIRLQEQLKKLENETDAQILFRHETEVDNPESENFDPLEMDRYSTMQQLSRSLVESVGDLNSLQDMLGGLTRDSELLLLQQGRVNSELQDRLMQARVVPFAATMASRLRRITRQTCQQMGKKAELKIVGANEEMDRHILDRMVAPLEHMLRNSIAHGIEAPEVRKSRGKPEAGTVTVSVGREGGEIVIQVADDGGGLDTNAIRKKAESKELITKNADMTDEDIMQLVLAPGFSTAESVSQIAGRGVGMDVVNNEIKQLNGSLHIESVIERGAALTVRLPFSLSITQALLVGVANDLYAIPLSSIEGVSRIGRDEAKKMIEDESSKYQYGGDDYQLSALGKLLGRVSKESESDEVRPALILVRAGGHRVGFYIDQLLGHHEIVVKSLGAQVSSVNGMAGGTILGDGRVALILDIPALVRMVGAAHGLSETRQVQEIETPKSVKLTVMVVDDSITVRRVTTRLLERHEMEVVTAKDGVDAVATLEDTIPDVMLLDVEMPRMDGYELATQMRNDARYKNVPIIMITSRTGAKHRDRAMAIGVDRYLGKPYQEMELLENINEVLEERKSD
jgi:chemosensory pili system protein ChpA (sensor histidine kinase/response regulator)